MGDVQEPCCRDTLSLRDAVNFPAWCRTRTTANIARYLVNLVMFSAPEKTVREFLMEIVFASRAMDTEWEISCDDVDEILEDGEDLGVSDMVIHTFDAEHLLVYFDLTFNKTKK